MLIVYWSIFDKFREMRHSHCIKFTVVTADQRNRRVNMEDSQEDS